MSLRRSSVDLSMRLTSASSSDTLPAVTGEKWCFSTALMHCCLYISINRYLASCHGKWQVSCARLVSVHMMIKGWQEYFLTAFLLSLFPAFLPVVTIYPCWSLLIKLMVAWLAGYNAHLCHMHTNLWYKFSFLQNKARMIILHSVQILWQWIVYLAFSDKSVKSGDPCACFTL